MSEFLLPVIALFVTVIGIISAIAAKFYLASKKENKTENFDKGKIDTQMSHFKEKFDELHKKLDNFEEDIQQGRLEHDSIQKQFADIRDRVGKLEGTINGMNKQ